MIQEQATYHILFMVLSITHLSSSLSCIQCNSIYSSSCISSTESLKHLYPCPSNRNYTLCRKIDQTVRGERRVMRKCGWEVGCVGIPDNNATNATYPRAWVHTATRQCLMSSTPRLVTVRRRDATRGAEWQHSDHG